MITKEPTRIIDLTDYDLKNLIREVVSDEIEKSKNAEKQDEILTRKEACRLMKISDATLFKLMADGLLKYSNIPGLKKTLFKRADIDQYLKENPDFKYKRK